MRLIETEDDIAEGIDHLRRVDPRLHEVIELAGPVPLRRRPPGFSGLCEIVVAQQLSKASADSIFRRLTDTLGTVCPNGIMDACDDTLRGCGLSAPKIRTLRAIAESAGDGSLPVDELGARPADEATELLTAVKGIGPWTAEVFLLFCLGHRDIFPAGDLALQIAVAEAFGMDERPKPKALVEIAELWSPWRGVAARLFWAYYRVCRQGRDAMPL
ncbi:MAG: DNA-3-methyladenine glycosidase [Hyphomicrobiales bacterium]|nr:MAG: DNA-3-methyladenine glycosidase [Hyphomicrobiales bacterium]